MKYACAWIARHGFRAALSGLAGLCLAATPALAQTKLVKHGTGEDAAAYYERIGADLGFPVAGSNLTDLISYLGYDGLSARDLEVIEPARLMASSADEFAELAGAVEDRDAFAGAISPEDFTARPILATRFLAPRIVDLSGPPPYPAGWRKLVRLDARPSSEAAVAGVERAYVQFDYVRAQDDPEPFPTPESADDRSAAIIQVLLVPEAGHATLTDGVYFILFAGSRAGYVSTRSIAGNFDLPPDPQSDGIFYVPDACGRCHGDVGRPTNAGVVFPWARLNFLNTDYWHDRSHPDDFFAEATSIHGVLFDGGRDEASTQYAAAFEVIRAFNDEIAEQDERAAGAPNDPNYQLQGARKWQELHAGSVVHAPVLDRSLGEPGDRWSTERPEDEPLLTLLSRHCYRCHNTIDFNVFLKPRFAGVAKSSISSVMFSIMPFGHNLNAHNPADSDALIEALKLLLAQG